MTKASDNVFPRFLISEGGSTATPAANRVTLYAKADGLLYSKDDAGAETLVSGGSAGAATSSAHTAIVQRASTNFALGNNTFTAVQWDAEVLDTDTMHDNVTNNTRVTIPSISGVTTGLWRLTAHGYTGASSGRSDVMFRKNAAGVNSGGTFINTVLGPNSTGALGPVMVSILCVLSGGDYVECFMRTSGGSFSLTYDAAAVPTFSVEFLAKVT